MRYVEVLEAMMFISFSISWYWSIAKMMQTKLASGKSIPFVLLICLGYVFGIGSELITWQEVGTLSLLFWIYLWNLNVIAFDALLVIHYARRRSPPRVGTQILEIGSRS